MLALLCGRVTRCDAMRRRGMQLRAANDQDRNDLTAIEAVYC
jgi:hypothetical protein